MAQKILVSGGTGYIGSHTCVELIQAGFEVLILDDLSNSQLFIVDRIEKITGKRPLFQKMNLENAQEVKSFIQEHSDIQGLIHFAAKKAVGESVEKPLLYYRSNLLSLINILESLKDLSIQNIIFSSSCTVYGEPDHLPVRESSPIKKAESPYGNTKQICEEILQDSQRANQELKVISLRYFNPVGAHASGLIGELPQGVPNNLMPFITQTALGLREELSVFGNDYDTPDGTCVRDYIHVVDLAQAHVAALNRLLDKKNIQNYEFFNIGTGQGSSVLEVIHSFEKTSNTKLNYKIVDRRPGDVVQIYADTALAEKELKWKAKLSLDDMTRSAWKWEQLIRQNLAK